MSEFVNKFCRLFDKVYIINLIDRKDRLEQIIKMLSEMGVYNQLINDGRLEIVSAVKMPFLTKNIVDSVNSNFNGRLGLFNCTYEHYRILSKMLSSNQDRILILEDDARFIKDIEGFVNAINSAPAKFNIIHLDGFFFPNDAETQHQWESILDNDVKDGKWVECGELCLWASGAIVWTREGAESFVETQKRNFEAVDLTTIKMENSYFFTVPLVVQESKSLLNSDITNCASNYDENNIYISKIKRHDYYQYGL